MCIGGGGCMCVLSNALHNINSCIAISVQQEKRCVKIISCILNEIM